MERALANTEMYRAACEGVALADFSGRARWRVRGEDAVRFLHGQCTNDVNGLKAGEGCYACFLTRKGKLRGDAVIYRLEDGLLVETAAAHAGALKDSLETFLIADDVQIEDVTETLGQGGIFGPGAARFLEQHLPGVVLPERLYQWTWPSEGGGGGIRLCKTERAWIPCFEWFAPRADFERLWREWAGSLPLLDAPTLEVLRVEDGIPLFGVDMDESTIPLEAGLESRAISYTKGCYVGQEVISRIHSLGHVNRHLAKLRVAGGEIPPPGSRIEFDGRDIGQVTSAVLSPKYRGPLALGYVRRELAKAGTKLGINNQPAEVIELCGRDS